jgi:hypothetical protein
MTTDGHKPYLTAVEDAFGADIDAVLGDGDSAAHCLVRELHNPVLRVTKSRHEPVGLHPMAKGQRIF